MGTEQEKKAIILETNFIHQNAKVLNQVVEQLEKHGVVYVTQVSVDERIARSLRDLRKQYQELKEKSGTECKYYVDIRFTKTIDEAEKYYRTGIQKKYERIFPGKIIPFSKSGATLERVLQRANDKIAPFNDDEKASDKGFKDSLIWLSIIDYFKENGEKEIVFITDDSGFRNKVNDLEKEFLENTGKKIEIKPNSFYKELIIEEKPSKPKKTEPLPDFRALRFELESAFDSITLTQEEDYYGSYSLVSAFHIYDYVDEKYAELFFAELRDTIDAHIFERMISPSVFFGINETEVDDVADVPVENFEKVLRLFERIKKDYVQYLKPFYTAFAQAVNNNRKDKPQMLGPISSEEIPF